MFLQGIVLVIDHADVITKFQRAVVVERGKASEIWPNRRLADPPIEINDIRMVFLHEFG
jgi:hypothetical protein